MDRHREKKPKPKQPTQNLGDFPTSVQVNTCESFWSQSYRIYLTFLNAYSFNSMDLKDKLVKQLFAL